MTPINLTALLDELERMGPAPTISEKRQNLATLRDRLLRLHAAGHSWAAIARALSTAEHKVTADLLRLVCVPKSRRRKRRTSRTASTRTVQS